MKRTLINKIDHTLPSSIEKFIDGSKIYDSSCSPEARVYYIERDEGYFLKISEKESLRKEAEMNSYFHKKGLCGEVLDYTCCDKDFLLSRRVTGEDLTDERFLSEPKRLARVLGERLRILHEEDFGDCPIKDRMTDYFGLVEKNYAMGKFDSSLTDPHFRFHSADEAYKVFSDAKSELKSDTLLHGDYCLPNVLFYDDWSFSGFIDLGNGGVGDRHIDIFWGAWTLWFNLKSTDYTDIFFDAYGKDKIRTELLPVIAAAECFG